MSKSSSREWIKNPHRNEEEYKHGVRNFINFVKYHSPHDIELCVCPCMKCKNSKKFSLEIIEKHLIIYGMLPTYDVWFFHGERNNHSVRVKPTQDATQKYHMQNQCHVEDLAEGTLENLIDDAFGVHNLSQPSDKEILEEIHVDNIDHCFSRFDHGKKYHEYKSKANEKLYPSCEDGLTTLSVIIELHNLKKEFNWSGNSMTELLKRMKSWLPKENTLPDKYPTMKKILKDLGMKVKCIHACENDCILFWKQNADAVECPRCHTPRFKAKDTESGVLTTQPRKVLRHFPIIPRLSRLYTIPWIARKMQWHKEAESSWEFMRHPIDSAEWRSIKSKWPEFASEGRNVWLGIATDGFNPNGVLTNSYSCWPVYIIPYNMPPSLCMKSQFQMLSILIPGPKAPSQDIDVYLEPLVDELKQLWMEGVSVFDIDKGEIFTMKAILLWGIHDFPAFGNLSGCVTHGYKACPVCAIETESENIGNKIVYPKYRRFLKNDHPYRALKHGWYKDVENKEPPTRLRGQSLFKKLDRIRYVPGKIPKNKKRMIRDAYDDENSFMDKDDDEERSAWYKKSILFDLNYWGSHKVRHTIDVMHTEKNVAEHIINLIFDKGKQSSKFALDKNHKVQCCQLLQNAKLPSCLATRLGSLVSLQPPGLHIKKTYDYHLIIQYFLPIMIQHAYPKNRDLRRAISQISLYFNIICSKVLVREHVQAAKDMISEALCVLAHYFPIDFFDISIHLMVHLADQALLCGPTNYIWMYPFERAMKDCKNIPRNKRYIEGSISEAYLISESVRYAMEYMPNPRDGNHSSTQASFLDENGDDIYERPIIKGKPFKLSGVQRVQIRRWILFRIDIPERDEYYSAYRSTLEGTSRGKRKVALPTEVVVQTEFIDWLHKKLVEEKIMDTMLWRYVSGPKWEAITYLKYRVNGYVFSPQHYDDTLSTQDSGVCMDAITSFVASARDINPTDDDTTWYGIIKEIIEVDYYNLQHVVFYCDWVNIGDKTNGCKICPDSNLLMVNLKKLNGVDGEYDEPAILATEASQVFYIKDTQNSDWSIIRRPPKRMTDDVDDYSAPTNFQSVVKEQPNLLPLLKCTEAK